MARQNMYKSPRAVTPARVRDEIHAQRRLVEAHCKRKECLREEAKEQDALEGAALEQLMVLVRADDEGIPVYEFRAGGLTVEPPDPQTEFSGISEE